MFQILSDMNEGIVFLSPDNKIKFQSPGTGFVDDVTLGATANMEEDDDIRETNLIQNINDIATYWERMLFTNGGRLELKNAFGSWCHGDGTRAI